MIIVIDIVWRLLGALVDAQRIGRLVFADRLFGTLVGRQRARTAFVVGVDIVQPIQWTRIDAIRIASDYIAGSGRLTVAG